MTYNTKQKDIIADYIADKTTDFSIRELCQELSDKDISQATIYRAIERLEERGVLKKTADAGEIRYQYIDDCDHRGHCYLKCNNCKKIEHVDCDGLQRLMKHVQREHSFAVDDSCIIINGLCKECQ